MDTICPTCRAEPGHLCRRTNTDDLRLPHLRRSIRRTTLKTIRLLWHTLPADEQLHLLADLPVSDARAHSISTVSLHTMPAADPGPEWRADLDRVHAARDLLRRAQNLLRLARQLYGHPARKTRRPSKR